VSIIHPILGDSIVQSSALIEQKPLDQELKEAKSELLKILKEIAPSCTNFYTPPALTQNVKNGLLYNLYALSEEQHKNLVVVISIMLQIVFELKKGLEIHIGKSLQEKAGTIELYVQYGSENIIEVPLHLQPYAQVFKIKDEKGQTIDKSIKPGDERARSILRSLVFPFIQSYETLSISPSFMRTFCEKLAGYCIDIRTRSAFRYASIGDFNIKPFTDILQKSYVDYSEEKNEGFFWFIKKVMLDHWGEKFKPDEAETGYAKEYGKIGLESYPLIKKGFFSLELSNIVNNNDFLFVYNAIPSTSSHLKIEFILVLLQHEKDLLQTFTIQNEEERKAFNTLILEQFNEKSFLHYLVTDCKEQKIAQHFISNITLDLLSSFKELWTEPLYSKTIGALEDKTLSKVMTICNHYYKVSGIESILAYLDEIIGQLTIDEFLAFLKYSNILSSEKMSSDLFSHTLSNYQALSNDTEFKINKDFIKYVLPYLKPDKIMDLLKNKGEYNKEIVHFLSEDIRINSSHLIQLIKDIASIENYLDLEAIIYLMPALFHKIKQEDEIAWRFNFNVLMNTALSENETLLSELLSEKEIPARVQSEIIRLMPLSEIKGGIRNISINPAVLSTIYKKLSENKKELLQFLFSGKYQINKIGEKLIPAFEYYYKKGILQLTDFPLDCLKKTSLLNYSFIIRMFKVLNNEDTQKLAMNVLPPLHTIDTSSSPVFLKNVKLLKQNKREKIIKVMLDKSSPEKLTQFHTHILSELNLTNYSINGEEHKRQHIPSSSENSTISDSKLAKMSQYCHFFSQSPEKNLYLASNLGLLEEVKNILEKKPNVDCTDASFGNTPLLFAARHGHLEIVELLLDHGATINKPANTGNTPLIEAAINGHLEVVKVLLARGADAGCKNNSDETAYHCAWNMEKIEIAEIISIYYFHQHSPM
jgi:hypothetical protein